MRSLLMFLFVAGCCVSAGAADQPILIVTPQGVWKINMVGGIPQPPVAADVTVIVQGFGESPNPNPPIPVDPSDPVIEKVVAVSISPRLDSKSEATACAGLVNSLKQAGLTGDKFKNALNVAAPIFDGQLKASGRVTAWAKAVTDITVDPDMIIAGLAKAWNMNAELFSAMDSAKAGIALTASEQEAVGAIDITTIMAFIATIITLLQQLGLLK